MNKFKKKKDDFNRCRKNAFDKIQNPSLGGEKQEQRGTYLI